MPPSFRLSSVASDFHIIVIQQLPCQKAFEDGRHFYRVKITVDDIPNPLERTFDDPCSISDHKSCLVYLNEMLNEGRYNAAIAKSTDILINEYGQELFKRLKLGEFSGNLKRAKIIIEIRESGSQQDTENTIHRIRWEQLEDQELWPSVKTRTITVRRVTSQNNVIGGPATITLAEEATYRKEKGRVNILLVIARSFEKNNGHYYDIDPGVTMSVILRMKRTLEERKSYHSIALEVVRPGTFDAFKIHLNSRPKGFFDIVHFDVHGRVTIQNNQDQQRPNTSYLHFLHEDFLRRDSEDAKNNLVGIPAKAIADELHRHQVPYAVLNACKSANPFGGNEGNLSRLFSMENSLKILAMSYNISGAAVKLLCERFYHSFFQDLDSFSDSARQARKGLRDYRIRVELYPRIEVQDWFVPVTYAHLDGQLPKSTEKSSRPWLNVSLRSHSRISTRSVSSASSYMSSKSVEHDNSRFLALQIKPDLVFERQLMRDNIARLFGPSEIDNETYLGYVTDLWCVTSFARRPHDFDCGSYMGPYSRDDRELDRAREYIWGSSLRPPAFFEDFPASLKHIQNDYTPRPIILFKRANALFPRAPTESQLLRIDYLNEFLEEVLISPAKNTLPRFRPPYIVFLSTTDIQSQSITTFPIIGGERFNYSGPAKTVLYTS